ncbi:hypothetical protein ABH909_002223 [Pseudomonas sp. BS3782 TE3695]
MTLSDAILVLLNAFTEPMLQFVKPPKNVVKKLSGR